MPPRAAAPALAVLALVVALAHLALPALAAEPLASGSFTDPQDAEQGAADLRRVAWTVQADSATVTLDTRERLNMHLVDYVAALVLGDPEDDAPREAYYVQQAPNGPVLVARHAPQPDARPQVTAESTRLRFQFPRTPAPNATLSAPECAFAVAGTGDFDGPVGVVDAAPDLQPGARSDEEPWTLRQRFCAPEPPPPRATPGAPAAGAAVLATLVALALRRR